jgi:hypothetical protein
MRSFSPVTRIRMAGTRRTGVALAALLSAGLVATATTAFASSITSPAPAGMTAMMSWSGAHAATGFTNGWYNGRTVRFFYSKNFYCKTPPASGATSRCEAGSDYTQTPAATFDPLYVVVPLGFTPPRQTLQCPVAGHCIDHPGTIDLSAVLGSGTSDLALPAHSHIVATDNSRHSEWWNVDVVGVKSLTAWNKIVRAKSDCELQYLQRTDSKDVTGNITTNLFLYFSVLP